MSTETQVSPGAETQNLAPDVAETPEVATPESQVTNDQPEVAEPEESKEYREAKAAKALERRLGKRTADLYRERAEKEQLAREVEQLRAKFAQPEQEETPLSLEAIKPIAEQMAQQLRQQEKFADQVRGTLKAGASLEGFDTACNVVDAEVGFYKRDGSPTDFLRVVLESDAPAKLLHHLGHNPELAEGLADLTPTQLARRLDRIEREMGAAPKTSSAPKPLTPVKAAGQESGLSAAKSDEEWARLREQEIAARRKR